MALTSSKIGIKILSIETDVNPSLTVVDVSSNEAVASHVISVEKMLIATELKIVSNENILQY